MHGGRGRVSVLLEDGTHREACESAVELGVGSGGTQCQGQRYTSANQYLWAGLVRTGRHSIWKTQGMFPACEEGCLVVAVGDSPKPAFLTYDKNKLQKTVALDGGQQHEQGDGRDMLEHSC